MAQAAALRVSPGLLDTAYRAPVIELDGAGAVPRVKQRRKVVLLNPGGEVDRHRRVRAWTADQPADDVRTNYNAGDLFVDEATARLLDYHDLEWVHFDTTYDQRLVDRINAEVAYCIVRGSNYIHNQMKWGGILDVLDKLKVPIIAFGIGAQAPTSSQFAISPDTLRFLKIVSDHSHSVGVRGEFTAETLAGLGVKNLEIIGCPSLMRHNRPSLDITLGELAAVRYVGFTLMRGLWPMYCQNIPKTRAMQRDLILDYAKRFDLTVMSQGEQPERAYWYRHPRAIEAAFEALVKDKWFTGPDDPLVQVYRTRMFFGSSPSAYEDLVKGLDLVVGFRLHGNVMALANGVPAIYVVYDMRMREVVRYFDIPAHDVMDDEPFALERLYAQDRFDRFNARYRDAYRKMAGFLDANGVAHLMQA